MRAQFQREKSHEDVVLDLKRKYPISIRWVMKRCCGTFLVIVLAGLFLIYGVPLMRELLGKDVRPWLPVLLLCYLALLLVFGVKLVYELLSRQRYYYAVEGSNVVIAKGIILRQRGCFPIQQITDIYLNRTLGEFIFGLYSLNVSTPTAHSAEFARIDGLPRETAIALQNELLHILYEEDHGTRTEGIEKSLGLGPSARAGGVKYLPQ
jgi:membrane protein YdbS with pleckstrin-like domain